MFKLIKSEIINCVNLITLNSSENLNALSNAMLKELSECILNSSSKVIVLTGSGKAFAAGADIQEMSSLTAAECIKQDYIGNFQKIFQNCNRPIIAAVNGFALGGGCELAMACDIIYAGKKAKFAQPEIKLGTIPGAGGTQRLVRAVGKSKAMEMILSGRHIDAEEAEKIGKKSKLIIGLISKVVEDDKLLGETLKLANEIGEFSTPIVSLCKEAVNSAFNVNLDQGLLFERRLFHSTFSMDDRKEGMKAFLEKRRAKFTNS